MTNPTPKIRAATLLAALVLALAGCSPNDPAALMTSAKAALAKGDAATATIQLKNLLQKAPDNAEARFLLARSLLQGGDAAGAATEVQKAVDLKYPADEAYPLLARALLARGDYQKVVALRERKVEDPKARADLNASIAIAQLNTGNAAGARAAVDAAAKDAPDDVRVLMAQAQVAAAGSDYAAAARYADAVLARNKNELDAVVFKAQLLSAQGKTTEAVDLLQGAAAAHPNALAPHFVLITLLAGARRLDEAKAQVAKLQAVAPNDMRTLYYDAYVAYASNDPRRAQEVIQKVLAANPDNLPSLLLAGLAQYQLGSYGAAEQSFTQVMNRAPENVSARRGLALTYIKTGRARQALDLMEPLLRAGSQDALTWRTAGEAALYAGNVPVASQYYERAVALDKENVGTQVRLAQVRMATGESARAFSDLEALSAADKSQSEADLALIFGHLRRREYDAALGAADKLVAKQPDSAVGYSVRGSVQLTRRDLGAARQNFDKALALDPKNYTAAYNLAMLDVREGKPAAAKARYEGLLAKDPDNEDLLLALGDVGLMTGGSLDDSRRLVDRAVVAHPQSVRPRLAQISLAQRQGDRKAAVGVAEAALAAIPGDPQIADAYGLTQLAAGNTNQALETYRRVAQAQPQNAMVLVRLAEVQAASKDLDGAVVSVRKAFALQPTNPQAALLLAKLLLATGHPDEALAEARKMQKESPDKALGYAFEGEVWALQKKFDEGTQAYRQALAKQPVPEVAARLYIFLDNAGKAADAKAFADQWNREHPKDVTVRVQAGQLAQMHNDAKAAIAWYRGALEIDPDNIIVLNNLAWLLTQAKDPGARDYAERAYRISPLNPNIIDTLGWTLVNGNDVARGTQLLRMASNMAPTNPEIRLHLGVAQVRAGDKSGARTTLEPLTKLDAKSPVRAEAEKTLSTL